MKPLPCPFCGEPKELSLESGYDCIELWVQCDSCHAQGPTSSALGEGPKAVELWNKRAPNLEDDNG